VDQPVSLLPALLSFLSFGALLILQKPKNRPAKKLWLVSADEAYQTRAFDEFYRIKREVGEGIRSFVLLDGAAKSPTYYHIELPSGRRDIIMKEWVDTALRKKVLVDVDPEARRKQQAKLLADRRARLIRARAWPLSIQRLVIEGKIKIEMTREQVMTAWGKPDQINHSEGDWKIYEQWIYGSTFLYFERGILKSYQEGRESHISD